jgi:hypothetical protein
MLLINNTREYPLYSFIMIIKLRLLDHVEFASSVPSTSPMIPISGFLNAYYKTVEMVVK